MLVSGVVSLTEPLAGLTGSRGLMAVVVMEPGAVKGGAEVLGVGVTRDCWLLRRD